MDDDRQTVTATPLPQTTLSLTPATMRDRYVSLMKEYAALHGKPTPAFLDKIVDFQTRVSALGTSLSVTDERTEAQATINYWQTVRINAGERPETVLLGDFDHEAARLAAGVNPPYKGLAPFQTNDAPFFSGRFALVNDLVKMVKSVRLVALTGLSGSGKSSIIRAGLIPNLKGSAYDGIDDDGLTDSGSWDYPAPILPGKDPLGALVAAFGPITKPADLPMALDARATAVVLSVDQFEEVYNLSPDTDRRRLFLDALVAAATTGVHRHIVIITMRSEFDSFVTTHEAFSALFKAGRRSVEAMQASDLRKVIEEPANRLGVGFEPGLVDELMTRVQGEPAGLPLLSFTLLKLWEMRAGGPMKMADYQTLGGNPREILANSADTVFEAFLKQDQDLARGIFTRLVKIGDSLEATSMRISRADLDVLGARDNVNRVLDILVDEGLLRTAPAPPERSGTDKAPGDDPNSGWWITPETQIEVAHEALIRNWGRLTEWVKDSFAEQTNRKAFALRAQKWADGGGDLLSGLSLDEAKDFPNKSPVETRYIAASRRHLLWRQRKFWFVTALVAALAVGVLILYLRLIHIRGTELETQRANTAYDTAVSLVDRGEILLAKKVLFDQLPDGTALPPRVVALLQSARLETPKEYQLRIVSPADWQAAMAASRQPNGPPAPAQPIDATIEGTGNYLASVWTDGAARVWRRADDGLKWVETPMVLSLPDEIITAVALSPNGLQAVSASVHRAEEAQANDEAVPVTLQFWDIGDDNVSLADTRKTINAAHVNSLEFAPSGQSIVLATNDGRYITVHGRTGAIRDDSQQGGFPPMNSATYSVDGQKILTASADGWVQLAELDGKTDPIPIRASKKAATSARFTQSGVRFAVGSADGIIRIYRTIDRQKLFELAGHRKGVTGIALSSDGSTLISSSDDGTLRFWELGINAGHLIRTIAINDSGGRPIPVKSVVLSDNNSDIVAALADGSIRAFDLDGKLAGAQTSVGLATKNFWPTTLAISPDRNSALTHATIDNSKPARSRYQLFDLKQAKARATWDDLDGGSLQEPQISDSGDQLVYTRLLGASGQRQDQNQDILYQVETRSMTSDPAAKAIALLQLDVYPFLVAMAPDGATIIIIDGDGRIQGFDKNGQKLRNPLQQFQNGDLDFDLGDGIGAFSHTGKPQFAVAMPGNPRTFVYDLTTGKIVRTFKSTSDVTALQFSPDGTGVFIGTDLGTGALHDIARGTMRRLAGQHDSGITFARFSPDAGTLVTGSNDATAGVWDVASGKSRLFLRGHQAAVTNAIFAPDGKRLLTESDDRSVKLWDLQTGRQLTTLRGPDKSDNIWGWFTRDGQNAGTLSDYPPGLQNWDTTPMLRTWTISAPPYGYQELRDDVCAGAGALTQEDIDRSGLDMKPKRLNCPAAHPAR